MNPLGVFLIVGFVITTPFFRRTLMEIIMGKTRALDIEDKTDLYREKSKEFWKAKGHDKFNSAIEVLEVQQKFVFKLLAKFLFIAAYYFIAFSFFRTIFKDQVLMWLPYFEYVGWFGTLLFVVGVYLIVNLILGKLIK